MPERNYFDTKEYLDIEAEANQAEVCVECGDELSEEEKEGFGDCCAECHLKRAELALEDGRHQDDRG